MKRLACYVVLAVFVLSVTATAADSLDTQIELRTYLEQDKVPLNREVVYQVELSWNGELNRYQIADISDPVVQNLTLRGSGSANKVLTDAQGRPRAVKRITYYFTPLEMGMAYVDGATIRYKDMVTGSNESLIAQRLGVEIVEPLEEPGSGPGAGKVAVYVLVLIFLGSIGYVLIRYYQQRKLQLREQQKARQTLEDRYSEMLHRELEPDDHNLRGSLDRLIKFLNRYLKEKFELETNSDFEDVEPLLRERGIRNDLLEKLKDLSEHAERARFAGEEIAASDVHLFYDSIELLLKNLNTK